MGNVDFFFNQYTAAQPNFNFAMAAADWLSNDDDIISIRNRIPAAGALDRIIDPEKRVAAFSLIRMINTVCVPLVVLLAGILLGMRRKKAAYQTTIKEDSREDTNAL